MRSLVLLTFLALSIAAPAQSGRTAGVVVPTASTPKIKQLFEETNSYLRTKAAEFEAKKIPFSDNRLNQLQIEQRQLAAKYAAAAGLRKDLIGEDFYYLGMLHWIAENLDGTSENLQKFIVSENAAPERTQTARSIVIVVSAKQKKLDEAEKTLADYLKTEPQKLTERSRMEGEDCDARLAPPDGFVASEHAASPDTLAPRPVAP